MNKGKRTFNLPFSERSATARLTMRNIYQSPVCRKVFGLVLPATLFLFAAPVFAHDGQPHGFDDLWKAWSFDPLVIVSLSISAAVYILGIYNLWHASEKGRGISFREAAAFLAGWIFMFIALVSPLHPWGEVLFSAHMTQHEILMLLAAPLFVLSRPFVAALWAMPRDWRKSTNGLVKKKAVQKGFCRLAHSRRRALDVAHSVFVRSDLEKRFGAHFPARELFSFGAPFLVRDYGQPARDGLLRRGRFVSFHDFHPQRTARRFSDFNRQSLVSGLRKNDGFVGPVAD
jgi:hypothetical protein